MAAEKAILCVLLEEFLYIYISAGPQGCAVCIQNRAYIDEESLCRG